MEVSELQAEEWQVLLALLAHLAEADDRIDPAEVLAVYGIADQVGAGDVMGALMRARAAVRTRAELLAAAALVERPAARALMSGLMNDLAQADGERSPAEGDLLDAVARVWGRAGAAG